MKVVYHVVGWTSRMPDRLPVRAWDGGPFLGDAVRVYDEKTCAKAEIDVPPHYRWHRARLAAEYVGEDSTKVKFYYLRLYTPQKDMELFGDKNEISPEA